MVKEKGKEEMLDATKRTGKKESPKAEISMGIDVVEKVIAEEIGKEETIEDRAIIESISDKITNSIIEESNKSKDVELKAKTMGNTDQNACKKNVKDVVIFGDDLFKLLSKASSEIEGWMKSTKAMDTGIGCVVQVTTQQLNIDGTYSVAEAVAFAPGVTIRTNRNLSGEVTGRVLVAKR